MQSLVAIGLIVGLLTAPAVAEASDRLVVAQAGSTGGTIGKQNKAISGSDEPRPSSRGDSSQRPPSRETLPRTIRLYEHSWAGTYHVTLHRVNGNLYEGTFNHGYATKFTVAAFNKDSITLLRVDNAKLGAVTGTYTGRRSGNIANGEGSISNGVQVRWDASW